MSIIKLGPLDLLQYDPRFGVLICRECQYGIQKSALSSHLLRHKIYRSEREELLTSIAQLNVLEPDEVPLPSPNSLPIDALPTISGFRCKSSGCGSLYASFKRMRRHWSEIHGLSEASSDFSSCAYPVKLQTFFRGTKIKYFEVASSLSADSTASVALLMVIEEEEDDVEKHDGKRHDELVSVETPDEMNTGPFPVNFDLETLTYFHHFIITTSLTLPSSEHLQSVKHYWQTDIVLQALKQRWLMCGLLAISACHLAALAEDSIAKRMHCERSIRFSSEFFTGWDDTTKDDSVFVGLKEEVNKTGKQISFILVCGQWSLDEITLGQENISKLSAPFQTLSFLTAILAFVVPDDISRPGSFQNDDDNRPRETLIQAKRILETRTLSEVDTSSRTFNRLRELPFRMAGTFGKPEGAQDVFAALSAIAALVECCEISFESDDVGGIWRGMAMWLTKITAHFRQMISTSSSAALVVLAHWAALLVERAEKHDYWFLKGLAKRVLQQIADGLPVEVQSLLDGLDI